MDTGTTMERDFRIDYPVFLRRTQRRMILFLIALVVVGAFFLSVWSAVIPGWVKNVLLMIGVGFIVIEAALFPNARKVVREIRVRLLDDGLSYTIIGKDIRFPYRELSIERVTRDNSALTGIWIKAVHGEKIELANFERMDVLYAELVSRIGRSKPA